jgi:very-short-patch-repair endonuclease
MRDLDRRLAAVAATQRQLITLEDVRRAGGDLDHAKTRCNAGRWVRVDRGVYLINGAPFDWTTKLLAKVLAAGVGAQASHLAAARLYGAPGFARVGRELSIARGRQYRRAGVRTHESTDLERCDQRVIDGVPVTDPSRTMLDLGRYVGDQRLTRTVEWARREGLVTWSSLISTLHRHARRGRPGIRRLRRVIAANAHREEISDSDMELLVLALLAEHGLPEPVLHHRVVDGDRFVAEVDLAYPHLRIAIECDGGVHLERDVWEADQRRGNDLALLGWIVLHFTWERYQTRPDAVVAEVRAAIDAARRAA